MTTPDLADFVGFECLPDAMGQDLEHRVAAALAAGADFGSVATPIAVFRDALRFSIRNIEEHPRGRLFQRFLKEGPYEGVGDMPLNLSGSRLSDKETASAISFIYAHMINAFQGRLAELLAAGPISELLGRWKVDRRVPSVTRLHVGDAVRVGINPGAAGAKGADMHLLAVSGQNVEVIGVVEVKSYDLSRARLRTQMERHLSRLGLGLRIGDSAFPPRNVKRVGGPANRPLRISVVPSKWTLPTSFRFQKNEKGRSLIVDPAVPPSDSDRIEQIGPDEWHVVLRWSHEALASAAYDMTFWYMERVGEAIYREGVPKEWSGMSPDEAGRNAAKMMLYYAILRADSWWRQQRAIAFYNAYGFGYALGMNFRKPGGEREMLWPEDLDEIAANGVNKDGCTIRGFAKGSGVSSRSPEVLHGQPTD